MNQAALLAVQTMQHALVLASLFTLWLLLPVVKQVWADRLVHTTTQVRIRLWRLLIGLSLPCFAALVAFGPRVLDAQVFWFKTHGQKLGVPAALLALVLSFTALWWCAVFAAAVRKALRERAPHPWDSEEWMDSKFVARAMFIWLTSGALMAYIAL